MLKNAYCSLRPVTEADLETIRVWRMSEEIRPYFTDQWIYSALEQKRWFETMSVDPRQRFLVAEDGEGNPYGVVNIQAINYQHGTATVGWYFVRENARNLGRLTQYAATLILDYAFFDLGLRKLYSDVLATNERALKFNSRLGFEVEGRQKAQVYHRGNFVDLIWVGLFREVYSERRAALLAQA